MCEGRTHIAESLHVRPVQLRPAQQGLRIDDDGRIAVFDQRGNGLALCGLTAAAAYDLAARLIQIAEVLEAREQEAADAAVAQLAQIAEDRHGAH
jgi:hypothetical protein